MKSTLTSIFLFLFFSTAVHAGLVAHWPLDESAGSIAENKAGETDGMLNNFPGDSAWVPGKRGNALRFDGFDDYVDLTGFELPRTRGTLMHWVKGETEEKAIIYYESDYPTKPLDYDGFGSGGAVLEIHSYLEGEKFGMYYTDGSRASISDGKNYNPTGWNHVALTWDIESDDLIIYINCEEQDRSDISDIFFSDFPTLEAFLGKPSQSFGDRYFKGLLDDVQVYDHVLTAQEMTRFCDLEDGRHAAVAVQDGLVKDDDLVDHICNEINNNGGISNVKDITLMVNSPFGGGLLDDMDRVFGTGGACQGIPWVAGAASAFGEVSRGWSDAQVAMYPEHSLGSAWTQALVGDGFGNVDGRAGAIFAGSSTNNILDDLKTAGSNDIAGPNGYALESPETATGNGGENIQWRADSTSHEAIVFDGLLSNPRHSNNLSNVRAVLDRVWQDQESEINVISGGNRDDLLGAISQAAGRLDGMTQLLIYISGRGANTLDFEQAFGGVSGAEVKDGTRWQFNLPKGWVLGAIGNSYVVPDGSVPMRLQLGVEDCVSCLSWNYYFNGHRLDFSGVPAGEVELQLPPLDLRARRNLFEISSQSPELVQQAGGSRIKDNGVTLVLSHLEIDSGPINDLTIEHLLLPGQNGAYYDAARDGEGIFFELLQQQKAVVYFFSYNDEGDGQAWMLGLGDLVGDGIVVTETFQPEGPTFGPLYDPNDVEMDEFGLIAYRLPTCGTSLTPGILYITPDDDDYEPLEGLSYVQLTGIVDCTTGEGTENSGFSGSWYDPSHNGEGIILEVMADGQGLVQWFTYDGDGEQMWIQGVGQFSGNTLTVSRLFTGSGTRWGSGFDASSVMRPDWGSLTMVFDSCQLATVDYVSTTGFGSGTLNMQRLTNLLGIDCED